MIRNLVILFTLIGVAYYLGKEGVELQQIYDFFNDGEVVDVVKDNLDVVRDKLDEIQPD